jgi:hypothetical protein
MKVHTSYYTPHATNLRQIPKLGRPEYNRNNLFRGQGHETCYAQRCEICSKLELYKAR